MYTKTDIIVLANIVYHSRRMQPIKTRGSILAQRRAMYNSEKLTTETDARSAVTSTVGVA